MVKPDPKMPREYLEALKGLVQMGLDETLEEGDGISLSSDWNIRTYTDLFNIIIGCADCAMQDMARWRRLEKQCLRKS